jgi:hypothetical protein
MTVRKMMKNILWYHDNLFMIIHVCLQTTPTWLCWRYPTRFLMNSCRSSADRRGSSSFFKQKTARKSIEYVLDCWGSSCACWRQWQSICTHTGADARIHVAACRYGLQELERDLARMCRKLDPSWYTLDHKAMLYCRIKWSRKNTMCQYHMLTNVNKCAHNGHIPCQGTRRGPPPQYVQKPICASYSPHKADSHMLESRLESWIDGL